jgi:hypothetical protein
MATIQEEYDAAFALPDGPARLAAVKAVLARLEEWAAEQKRLGWPVEVEEDDDDKTIETQDDEDDDEEDEDDEEEDDEEDDESIDTRNALDDDYEEYEDEDPAPPEVYYGGPYYKDTEVKEDELKYLKTGGAVDPCPLYVPPEDDDIVEWELLEFSPTRGYWRKVWRLGVYEGQTIRWRKENDCWEVKSGTRGKYIGQWHAGHWDFKAEEPDLE